VLLSVSIWACGGGGSDDAAARSPAGTPPPRWVPAITDTWHWQLQGPLDTRVQATVYDVDLFDTSAAQIAQLHAQGRKVVCYFSAGTAEAWRADFSQFAPQHLGRPLADWPGERWTDTRAEGVRQVLLARLDLAVKKGCDAVEPDNMDAYRHPSGFALTADTQLTFNRFVAAQAHARGLAVGLKNDVEQLVALEPSFDFAVNEQCFHFNECSAYAVFTRRNKAVFNAEYAEAYRTNARGARDELCAVARRLRIRTLVLPVALDGSFRHACD
jgi:hypothetical protein